MRASYEIAHFVRYGSRLLDVLATRNEFDGVMDVNRGIIVEGKQKVLEAKDRISYL